LIHSSNLIHAIDGALDSGINLFYLAKDGIKEENSAYLKKQRDRIISVFDYLKSQLTDSYFFSDRRLGITELNLYTALDWFAYRNVFPVTEDSILSEFLKIHGSHSHLIATAPPK
jgi:glutathione S-transferase